MNSDYIRSLPAPVKRRIKALKNLQKRHMELECNFHKEMHLLELKYEALKVDLEKKVHFMNSSSDFDENLETRCNPRRLRANRGGIHLDIRCRR